MEKSYLQMLFQLGEGLARRLRADVHGLCRLAQAAKPGYFDKDRDGAQFVDSHGVVCSASSFGGPGARTMAKIDVGSLAAH